MEISLPENLRPLVAAFAGAGAPAYAVGGLVRNALLGLPPSDVDVASPLTPAQVEGLFAGTDIQVINKAVEFGTVELHGPAGLRVEHTTFRREAYPAGGRHRPETVALGGTLKSDAFRRDFTVNALYASLTDGQVSDPTGGLVDLKNRILRTTSADPDDILGSDALRVLRLVRFAGELGFAVEENTWAAAVRHAPALSDVAPERRRQELDKILLCDAKYGRGPEAVLEALQQLDELDLWFALIPEMAHARGMAQRPDHHRYDVAGHMLHACAAAPPNLTDRLAALLHDVGKPACREQTGNLYLHDLFSEALARRILTDLRYPREMIDRVCPIIRDHMYDVQGTAREETLRVKFVIWGREQAPHMIAIRESDIRGCGYQPDFVMTRWRDLYQTMLAQNVPFSERELAVSGKDVMEALGIGPGERVGLLKQRLLDHCARFPQDNNRETLLKRLRDYQ